MQKKSYLETCMKKSCAEDYASLKTTIWRVYNIGRHKNATNSILMQDI